MATVVLVGHSMGGIVCTQVAEQVHELESDHSPFLSVPQELAHRLSSIAVLLHAADPSVGIAPRTPSMQQENPHG